MIFNSSGFQPGLCGRRRDGWLHGLEATRSDATSFSSNTAKKASSPTEPGKRSLHGRRWSHRAVRYRRAPSDRERTWQRRFLGSRFRRRREASSDSTCYGGMLAAFEMQRGDVFTEAGGLAVASQDALVRAWPRGRALRGGKRQPSDDPGDVKRRCARSSFCESADQVPRGADLVRISEGDCRDVRRASRPSR